MKIYHLYLKSHSDQPDYEDEVEAESFQEAVEYFLSDLGNYGWTRKMIEEGVGCEDECPDCHTDLIKSVEPRDGGYKEIVRFCESCGYTEIQKGFIQYSPLMFVFILMMIIGYIALISIR